MARFLFSPALGGICFLGALSMAPAQTNSPPPSSGYGGITEWHDVVIGKGGEEVLHAEVAFPKPNGKLLPAVIWIHGGGWVGGSYKQIPLQPLALHGYFAASIEYRLSSTAKWPAQIEDCKLAVRWLRAQAAEYQVDPNRIGVWGASAGGHLAVCLGTMADIKELDGTGGYPEQSSAVQAVVDFFGPTDLVTPGIYTDEAKRLTEGLFGVAREKNPELWRQGSPVFFVKAGDPPMLLVHGDSDGLVPVLQSTVLDAALTKAGVPHQLLIVKNANHGFVPLPGKSIDPGWGVIMARSLAFLDQYLK